MKSIAGVLNHFGGTQRHQRRLHIQAGVETRHLRDSSGVFAAYHHQRGLNEVPNGHAFAQEFRIRDHADFRLQTGEHRHHHFIADAGEHGAANGYD